MQMNRYGQLIQILLKLARITYNGNPDIVDLGKELQMAGVDDLFDGGFWIWCLDTGVEYYSPNFYNALGFEDREKPYTSEFWKAQITEEGLSLAMKNYNQHVESGGTHPYDQIVSYNKKDGTELSVVCSGGLVRVPHFPEMMVGTHRILE